MKFVIVLAALCVLALAAADDHVEILKQDSKVDHDGYSFEWETSDHTKHQEEGKVVGADGKDDHGHIEVHGEYSWKDHHGKEHSVKYVADKLGYHPSVSHSN
ncbi:larval cuticle protein 9-like [Haematobia irritans]|uniref:larval cuticle protein 9-like n=1 Tax=Haematobia irritans TaxID=7368 RepID=UPI003F4F9307